MSERPQDEELEFRNQLVALLPRLRRFALSLTGDITDADDLVQNACEHALTRRHQWQPDKRLDSWMFAIIHHLLIDETRTMRRKKVHVPFEEGRFLTTAISSIKKLEAKLRLKQVAEAMQRLTDKDRLVISLICIDGMSYSDAAETMQIPVGTVMSRLARARKKLHELVNRSDSEA
jgi:RNA polymerase sigma-70 factor (ECF subfamily)